MASTSGINGGTKTLRGSIKRDQTLERNLLALQRAQNTHQKAIDRNLKARRNP